MYVIGIVKTHKKYIVIYILVLVLEKNLKKNP